MFQNLRAGSPLFILHKTEPKLVIGEVSNVSLPVPQMGQTFQAGVYSQPKTTVDVKVKVNGEIIDYQRLPSDMNIADFGNTGMVISESKDCILNEIQLLKKNSEEIIGSVEHHKSIVEQCNIMIEDLNPEAKKDAERGKEIDSMRSEIQEMKKMLAQVLKSKS